MQLLNSERMRRIVVDRLESLQQAGVMQLPRRELLAPAAGIASPVTEPVAAESTAHPVMNGAAAASKPIIADVAKEERLKKTTSQSAGRSDGSLFEAAEEQSAGREFGNVKTLDILQQLVAGCTRCGELAHTRNQTVFGVGNPNARLCFLGEAPGADEDRLGEPFVGRAGQLLTKIIEACKMNRKDVYILNMIKCRPPGNRNPLPTELANCRGYLERQLDLIDPEFICCCGAVAAQNLLNTTLSIGKLRGKIHNYRGIKVVCTYHPAFLLRSPAFKKETWEDMKFLMREMGMEIG
jgi:DNA polymerase